MVVDSNESLNTIKEEAGENIEPPTKHSLALKDKVIMFVEAFKHKIEKEEEEVQGHYAIVKNLSSQPQSCCTINVSPTTR